MFSKNYFFVMMKTLRLIGMAIMMVLVASCFTACSSDDDDSDGGGGSSKSLIVGRWILTEKYNSDGSPKSYLAATDGEGYDFDMDGTYRYFYGGYRLGGSWQDIWENRYYYEIGTYTVKGNTIYLKVKDEEDSYEYQLDISSMNKNEMKTIEDGKIFVWKRFSN